MFGLRKLTQYRPGIIARNSAASTAIIGAKLLIQLPLLLLLARYLGPAGYGEFAGLVAFGAGIGTISSFGTGFLVLGDSARDPEDGQRTLSMALPLTLITASLLLPLYLLGCWYFLNSNAAPSTLFLIGTSELLAMPLIHVLAQRVRGTGNVVLAQGFMLIPISLRLVGLAICILLAPTAVLNIYALAYFVATLLAIAAVATITRQKIGWPKTYEWPNIDITKRGARFAIMMFTNRNPSELDKSLALRLLSSSDAGVYSIAARGTMIAIMPAVALLQSSQPRLFSQLESQPRAAIRLIGLVLGSAVGVGLLAGIGVAVLGPPFLIPALGPQFRGLEDVLPWFGFIAPVMALRIAAGGIFVVLERPLIRSVVEGSAVAILVLVAIWLTPLFGFFGLFAALAVSEIFMVASLGFSLWLMLRGKAGTFQSARSWTSGGAKRA